MPFRAKLRRAHAHALAERMREGGVVEEADAPGNLGNVELRLLTQERARIEVTARELNILRRQAGRPGDHAAQSAIGPAELLRQPREAAARRAPHHAVEEALDSEMLRSPARQASLDPTCEH